MQNFLTWIWDKKAWIFSGIGVVILVATADLVRRKFFGRKEKAPFDIPPEPKPAAGAPRVFVTKTPFEILSHLAGRTSFERDTLLDSMYRNKWMEGSFVVTDVDVDSQRVSITLKIEKGKDLSSTTVFAHFDKKVQAHLTYLQSGDPLKVRGRIRNTGQGWIGLDDCELVP